MDQAKENEFILVIERVFDAPRERVWKAWTDHELRMKWMSPDGLYVGEDEGKIQAGGSYEACMINSAGDEIRYAGEYREIVKPERLVFTHAWKSDIGGAIPNFETLCTVDLEELSDGKTKMTFTQQGLSSEDSRDNHNGGWSECFDKLLDILNTP
ncbi:MAG: SRPBCC domain-containing protein [Parvularculales bacterium]